ncbi:uncharacterized protein LOC123663965 [Melitaea cinxia]|uniref:uncharacterized protein LOC123663965 n=1 Tax=Melitaea cinxia TaxID=113334 RepID=UPI001E272D12|nr:uncharacterized protein LOC123663965 [Melitaea cinxia]
MKYKNKSKVKQRLHLLSLKVHLTNIRGLHSNLVAVHHHLETEKPHLLFLTETQIGSPADVAYLQYPGGDRETTRMFDYLSETADVVQRRYPAAQMVFLGDFNAHHQDWLFPYQNTDHAGREALKFALSLDLTQLVQEATRVPDVDDHTPNCLDLLMTTDPDRSSVSIAAPLGTSNHCVVKSISNFHPPDASPTGTRRVCRYKSADWDEMRHFFASYPWRSTCFSSCDPSSCEQAISGVIRQAMEYFIPFADVSLDVRVPRWYNVECAEAAARKDSAFAAWAEAPAKSYKKVLKRARYDRINRIGAKLASYPCGSKAFWSLSKSVEMNFCRPSLPPLLKPDGSLAITATDKANLLANLLAENSHLDAGSASPPRHPASNFAMSDICIHQTVVLRALRNLDTNKASGPDGIPARVLKTCAPELSPVLTRLYHLSLKSAQVSKAWKIANVQPVPKKGSRADPANYRPIAITSILCKSLERILNDKLLAYLELNDLLTLGQSDTSVQEEFVIVATYRSTWPFPRGVPVATI